MNAMMYFERDIIYPLTQVVDYLFGFDVNVATWTFDDIGYQEIMEFISVYLFIPNTAENRKGFRDFLVFSPDADVLKEIDKHLKKLVIVFADEVKTLSYRVGIENIDSVEMTEAQKIKYYQFLAKNN